MLTRALARPAATAAGLACLATFALAGCSGQDEPEDPPVTRATTSTSPTAPEETGSSAPAEPSSTPADPSSTPAEATEAPGLAARLLAAADLPGFNDEYRWEDGTTRPQEPTRLFGTCQRFAMTSIGATEVALREFEPADPGAPDSAGELVAEFPDSATARRAFEVLKSWRAKCAGKLKRHDRAEIGRLEPVDVDGGTGGWYLLSYGPPPGDPDAGYFDAQGMAVVGSRIAMIEMVVIGQDYNYEQGQEPAVAAVQRAAAKLS
jgi:hypothetical protein